MGSGRVRFALAVCFAAAFIAGMSALVRADDTATSSLIVKTAAGLSQDDVAAVIARDGGVEVSSVPALRLHVMEVPTSDLPAVIQNYQSDPRVERVEQNQTRKVETLLPADPLYDGQWYLPKIGWDVTYGSSLPFGQVTVAVLDTGVDASHPDLACNMVAGTSIIDSSGGTTDPNGHGTNLAGIVAAVSNNIGIAGVGFSGVSIMPVTVLGADGTGKDADIIAGIMYAADHGAGVILMGFSNPGFSQNLQDAIDYAWSKNVVLVAAVGNDASSDPTYPAGDRGVMGVSATDPSDQPAPFSNSGKDVFIAAPGVDILTTGLDHNNYPTISGTSASSAIVAGVAAFLRAYDATLTNGAVVWRIASTADAAGSSTDETGNGRINMYNAVTGTDPGSVEPAGAPGGGPYVGPYVAATTAASDGDGTMTVSPASVAAGSAGNSLTFTFTATPKGHNFNLGSQAAITIPAGWTPPQHINASSPGYITVTNGTGIASIASISGMTITINMTASSGQAFTVTYADATAPAAVGNYTFITQTKQSGGTLTNVKSGSPAVLANAAPTLDSISPAGGNVLAPAFNVTFTGTNFIAGVSKVNVGTGITVNSTTVQSGTRLTANITIGSTAPAGLMNFSVTNTGNGGGTSGTQPFMVYGSSQTITFNPLPVKTYGDADFAPGATASSGLTVTYASSNTSVATIVSGNIHIAGAGSATITASQAGDSTYNAAADVSQSLTITPKAASVTPAAAGKTYGDPDPALTGALSGFVAADSVTASYSRAAGETVTGGPYTISATLSPPAALGNYSITYNTASFTIGKATPAITWSNPADIAYGTALGATQLNASVSGVAGTLAYTPAANTVLSAGSHTLHVEFTPADTADYNGAAKDVTISVYMVPVSSVSLTPSVIPGNVGSQATFTASASGGSGSPEYSFWVNGPGTGGWANVQAYSASATCNWTPAQAGDYTVVVWARNAGSAVWMEAQNGTDYTVNP